MKLLACACALLFSAFAAVGAQYKISDLQQTNTVGGGEWIELDQGGIKSWRISTHDLWAALGTNSSVTIISITTNISNYSFTTNQVVYQTNIVNVQITTNLTVYQTNISNVQITTNQIVYQTNINNVTITTNLTVYQTNISNWTITTNLITYETNYTSYSWTTNLTVNNIANVKTLFVTNITVITALDVPLDGHFGTITVTNNSYFYGPALSYSLSASNSPAENELPTAHWVRSLFNNGLILYNTTNVFTQATNTDEARPLNSFTNIIPQSGRKHYPTVNLNDYIGSVIATNRFQFLQGPVLVHAFLEMTNGLGSPSVSVHPELYFSYDGSNWQGDWSAQNQALTTGTNLYEWVISFPSLSSTNATGFLIQRRFKVGAVGGATHPGVVVHVGTNYLSGTNDAGHISIQGVNSASVAAAVNFNELLSISNVWDGAFTNGVVDFGARKVVWNLTNGISFTNFAGLELNTGTRALVLEMWLEGCTSSAPAVLFPTMGAASYSVRIYTNDYAPVLGLVTNATKQWLLWEAHGTNITLDARVYF